MSKSIALIIEDSAVFSLMFSKALSEDFDTEVIQDGETALQRLSEVTPHLVLLDLHLPGASGRQILDSIRTDPRFSQTRILLTTGDERQAEELQDEVDLVLLKPILPSQLRDLAVRMKP